MQVICNRYGAYAKPNLLFFLCWTYQPTLDFFSLTCYNYLVKGIVRFTGLWLIFVWQLYYTKSPRCCQAPIFSQLSGLLTFYRNLVVLLPLTCRGECAPRAGVGVGQVSSSLLPVLPPLRSGSSLRSNPIFNGGKPPTPRPVTATFHRSQPAYQAFAKKNEYSDLFESGFSSIYRAFQEFPQNLDTPKVSSKV